MRQTSRRQGKIQRRRNELKRRIHGRLTCPRCQAEEASETHERVRRSQLLGAGAEIELMVQLGPECHRWVTTHPREAVEEILPDGQRLAMWRWEYDLERRAGVDPVDGNTPQSFTVNSMPRPKVFNEQTVSTRLAPVDAEWLDRVAAERGISRGDCLRRIVTATREQHEQQGGAGAKVAGRRSSRGGSSARRDTTRQTEGRSTG